MTVSSMYQEEVVALLAEAMMAKLGKTQGFLIDGFPASLAQVLNPFTTAGRKIDTRSFKAPPPSPP